MSDDSSTRSWDAIADDWVAHADTNDYRNAFLMPRMLAMAGDVGGLDVLDVGCGEGGYCRELAQRGARVVGIDGSPRLIEIARARLALDFRCLNANHLDGLETASFDRVIAAMSLMDVEDYAGAIREIARVLRGGGELLTSITHPCFQTRASRWIKDDAGQLARFVVDHYFEREAWEEHLAASFARPYVRRHRPLEDYMAAPLAAGLVLRGFHEPSPTDDELARSPRFARLRRVPYFLFMRWSKP